MRGRGAFSTLLGGVPEIATDVSGDGADAWRDHVLSTLGRIADGTVRRCKRPSRPRSGVKENATWISVIASSLRNESTQTAWPVRRCECDARSN